MSATNRFEFSKNNINIRMTEGTLQDLVVEIRDRFEIKRETIVPIIIQLKNTDFCPDNYILSDNSFTCGYSILLNFDYSANYVCAIMNLQSYNSSPVIDYRCRINYGNNSDLSDCSILWF